MKNIKKKLFLEDSSGYDKECGRKLSVLREQTSH